MTEQALYRLLTWLSPAYPVGGFSYSHGLEWAVESGDISDGASLHGWIRDVLTVGGGRNDAILLRHAHEAADVADWPALCAVMELALAFTPSGERWLETTAQGMAFFKATRGAWPAPALEALAEHWQGAMAYPVVVGAAAAAHDIASAPTLNAYLHGFASNLVSAGVRLVPLGQSEGLRIIAALEPEVATVAASAAGAPLNALGGCAVRADLASMLHETQYTRLFRS